MTEDEEDKEDTEEGLRLETVATEEEAVVNLETALGMEVEGE